MIRKVTSHKVIYTEFANYQQIKVAIRRLTLDCGHVVDMPYHAPPVLKKRNCPDCPRKPRQRRR